MHAARLFEEHLTKLALGIVIFDHRREVTFCNPRYVELYDCTPSRSRPELPYATCFGTS